MNEHHTFFESFDPSLMEILSSNVMLAQFIRSTKVSTYVPTLTLLNLPTTMLGNKPEKYIYWKSNLPLANCKGMAKNKYLRHRNK